MFHFCSRQHSLTLRFAPSHWTALPSTGSLDSMACAPGSRDTERPGELSLPITRHPLPQPVGSGEQTLPQSPGPLAGVSRDVRDRPIGQGPGELSPASPP